MDPAMFSGLAELGALGILAVLMYITNRQRSADQKNLTESHDQAAKAFVDGQKIAAETFADALASLNERHSADAQMLSSASHRDATMMSEAMSEVAGALRSQEGMLREHVAKTS